MPISVLVADAQPLFAEVLAEALTEYEDLAVRRERPQSAAELAAALGARRPDVAVLDYHLDAVSADEVATAVSVQLPRTKMVFLSWLHQEVGVRGVLNAGAVGYLPKSCDFDWVAEAVRRAHAGERPVFGDALANLLADLAQRRVIADEAAQRVASLTGREFEVLQWLATARSVADIAEQLGVTVKTVQTHIRNLKRKTGARTQLEAVRLAQGKAAACLPDALVPL